MAKCQVTVEIDQPDRAYIAGEEVTGIVRVVVDKDVRCDGLTVSCGWFTHGRGNKDSRDYDTRRLFEGEWRAGQTIEYPLQFVIPNGPVTYRGKSLNVDWGISARADIPWAIDPKGRAEFLVLPDRSAAAQAQPGDGPLVHDWSDATGVKSPGAALGLAGVLLVFALIAGVWGALNLFGVINVWPPSFFCLFVSVLMLVGAISYGAKGLRNRVSERKLGVVHFETSRSCVRRGDTIDCSVMIGPPQPVEIRSVTARLRCTERVVSGSGTNQTTHSTVVHDESYTLHEGGRFTPPAQISGRAAVPIAESAGLSFSARNSDVMWTLEVRVDVPRYPDWVQLVPITVGA